MPDFNKISKYVLEELRAGRIDKATAISLIKKFNEREDIAIIGIGCKFSNTERYEDYWELLKNKRTAIERCSKRRIDLVRSHFPKQILANESLYCKGAFIQDIEMFDHDLFSMTREKASTMNPGHRMMIQAVYRTLEDAGYLGEKNLENKTGVFVGNNFTKDALFSYAHMALEDTNFNFSFDYMLNNWSSGLATRVANLFDLKGGAYTVDASCPSSTIAIINACQALKNKQCTTAIAGGLLVDMAPIKVYNNSGWIFLHEDDITTRSYDDNPGGAYLAEGAAAVYLKPLTQAIEDGDRIHGIICGYSFNNNGANGSFTQSSVEDIKKVVVKAIKNAQVDVNDIDYLEGEGYPNKVEEGLELAGLAAGFSQLTERKQFCGLGSISANVGYLQSAIGVFSLIKIVMAMKHRTIPPIYHFVEPTDMVNLSRSPFYVSDMAKEWTATDGKPRLAAMYSYGYGGNNLLSLVQEAPPERHSSATGRTELFVLSARSEKSFKERIRSFIALLSDERKEISFSDLCYTASVCRPSYGEYRLAILAKDRQELLAKLKELAASEKSSEGVYVGIRSETEKNRKLIRLSPKGKRLEEIAESFCVGKNYLFAELYEGMTVYREELPDYPFDKQRCWSEKKKVPLAERMRKITTRSNALHGKD